MGKYTGDMDRDLKVLIPEVVADTVTPDPELADALVAKAKRLYRVNPSWGRRITDTDKGRDTLYMFMSHWLDGHWYEGQKVPPQIVAKIQASLKAKVI